MKGWSIFAHSVGMVTRNLSEAMRVALVPVLIGFALIAALIMTSGLSLQWNRCFKKMGQERFS